mgnify:CR=1 FL=1
MLGDADFEQLLKQLPVLVGHVVAQHHGSHGRHALAHTHARLQRLLALAQSAADRGPLVLAGPILGAWIAGRVSLEVPVAGLFLMAPPITMGPLQALDASPVPISIIHGWDDELIPAQHVVDWAAPRRARLLLVDDSHRLSEHVEASAQAFAQLLQSIRVQSTT